MATYGARGSLGLFVTPWEARFGASRADIALVSTVGFLVFAAGQTVAGRIQESVPGRRLVLVGVALCALGYGGAAFAPSLPAVVLLVGVLAASGIALSALPVLSVLAADLVRSREGMVFGLLTAAGAGGQVVVLPLAAAALNGSERGALLVIAGVLGVALAGVALAVPRGAGVRPEDAAPSVPVRGFARLWREPRFWLLLVPFFVCGYTTTGLMDTHFIPYAVDHHVPETVASGALATLAAFNVLGVLVAGGLTDRVDRGRLLAILYAGRAGSLLLLPLLTSPRGLFVFAVLFGVVDFATVPPTTALTRRVFHTGGWAVALGVISAAHQVGSALGAYLGGWLYDRTGGYEIVFASAAVALLAAAAMSLRLAGEQDLAEARRT